MKIYFSESQMGFYFDSLLEVYEESGTLPKDIVEISSDDYYLYQSNPPDGMRLGAKDGKPLWISCLADKMV
ncbi:hypothetical protein ACRA7N_10635 [Serratia nematodiphila]|uniref:hypothetical protein n=1 Tax=Serratia marcescens TaxID=615 RepID=UPI00148E49F8|nr:hypothetical protein [Serratia marcescens]QJU40960.1 hypothetical protein HMI62_17225 [Serratia marcescens]